MKIIKAPLLLAALVLVSVVAAVPATAAITSQGKAGAAAKKSSCLKKKQSSWRINCLIRQQDSLSRKIEKLENQKSASSVGTIGTAGPAGPQGPKGDRGEQGPGGSTFGGEPIFSLGALKHTPTGAQGNKGRVISGCPEGKAALTGWAYSDDAEINLLVGYDTSRFPYPQPNDRIGQFLVEGFGSNIYGMAVCVNQDLVDWKPLVQP